MKKSAAAIGIAAGLLAGNAHAQTEIEFWHAMGGQLGEATERLVAEFNASQSDIVLTPVYRGSYEETLTAAIAAFRAGEQPNIVQVFDAGAATVIGAEGATIPVETLMSENGVNFDIEDYISGVRGFYAAADGTMIGMPFNSSAPIMYYNETALEEAGVTPPVTWEEFAEVTGPALLEAGYVPMAQSHLPWIMTENFFSRHNLQFASNSNGYEGIDTQIMVNHPAIRAHFQALADWQEQGLFGWYGTGWGDNQTPFENGEVAMWFGSSASYGGLAERVDFPFNATMLPYWEAVTTEPTQSFIGGAALFAMAGFDQEQNEATAKFFEFLASVPAQVQWHTETGYVPITTAAFEATAETGFYGENPTPAVAIEQLQLPGSEFTRGYRMGFYVQIRDVMNREYSRILTGETTVDEAFETIEAEANELLSRFAQTQG